MPDPLYFFSRNIAHVLALLAASIVFGRYVVLFIAAFQIFYIASQILITPDPLLFVLCGIMPHGFLEGSALVLAYITAWRIGKHESIKEAVLMLRQYLKQLALVVALLLLAACIEAYVTPHVLTMCGFKVRL